MSYESEPGHRTQGDPAIEPQPHIRRNDTQGVSGTSMPDAADNLQPVGSEPVAYGTDAAARPVGQLVLQVIGGHTRITCPPGAQGNIARGIIKKFPDWDWLTGDRVWTLSTQWAEPLARDLRNAGYDVQLAGTVVPVRSRRTALPECPGDRGCCRAPFRVGTPLPLKCSQCGEQIERFHYYDPDR